MGISPFLLNTQYRMHPSISSFPNSQFYNGLLEDGVDVEERETPPGILWPDWNSPLSFLPVDGDEVLSPDGASKENPAEASWVVKILMDFVEKGNLHISDIGIVTPYSGQVRAIRDMIPENLQSVEVRTVDGYQGREKEVIIFSSVRSNKEGNVGFLSDSRRLNVALTRSRRGLIVVGNPDTLRHDENWNAWIEHIRSRNLEAWHLLGTA